MENDEELNVEISQKSGNYWEAVCQLPSGHWVTAVWNPQSPYSAPESLHVHDRAENEMFTGVTSEVMRSIPLRLITATMRSTMEAAGWPAEAEEPRSMPNVGRAGRGKLFFAHVAEDYASLVGLGDRSPIATMARRQGVPVETIRARVKRARALGLLEGPAGEMATITQAALDLLQDAEEEG